MKTFLLILSLALSLQSTLALWREEPAVSIQIQHEEVEDAFFTELHYAFQEALDDRKESLEISSFLRRNYLSEEEALEEVRDIFFSLQSHPKYFMYKPEIRAYWQGEYGSEGLGFSSYEVEFELLSAFRDEEEQKDAWKKISEEIEELAFSIRSHHLSPMEELELAYALLSKRAVYEKTEDLRSNNLFSCLLESKTQCTGFSQSLYLLAKSLGYPSRIVHGQFQDKYHSWNQVQLEGKWYHLDLTADLDLRDNGYTLSYFLRGDAAMTDHQFTMTTQDHDYLEGYVEKGLYVDDEVELQEVISQLFNQPGTYYLALGKEMDLNFLPGLIEELKRKDFPYHQVYIEQEAQRLKIRVRNEKQASEREFTWKNDYSYNGEGSFRVC